jgi:hypothetical protein
MHSFRKNRLAPLLFAPLLAAVVCSPRAAAQIAVSANDNKVTLIDGVSTVVQNPPPDTVAIIDLKQFPPKILAEIDLPTSDHMGQSSAPMGRSRWWPISGAARGMPTRSA